MTEAKAIKIAITALGGQGGGVLANWIVRLGERAGYLAQSTSVPGVAQRTGATVYYVELFPRSAADEKRKAPVLALMPASGDVDIVIASEFMEAGRAILRGFVSDKTTLIASSHRDYAIGEKIAMGDGREAADRVRQRAMEAAGHYIEADMAGAAEEAGAVISAVLFGALAGSNVLPITRETFEETIREGARAVDANMKGFARGYDLASGAPPARSDLTQEASRAGSPASSVAPLLERMRRDFPPETHFFLREGLKRTVDYQDVRYAELYLDRLSEILELDRANGGASRDWRLTATVAKHLALWMTYEDSIRVADLKTRGSRFDRFREDVRAEKGQIVNVSEYLHPRVEEVCDILPSGVAKSILKGAKRKKLLAAMLGEGRRIPTTKLRGFLLLRMIAGLRPLRRSSYRFKTEQARIEEWLDAVKTAASFEYDLACEISALQRLIKGYGETHERGLASFNAVLAKLDDVKAQPEPASTLRRLHEAALKGEDGLALRAALSRLEPQLQAAQ